MNVKLACAMLELMSRPDLNKMGMVLVRRTFAHGKEEQELCLAACQRIASSQVSQLFIDSTLQRMEKSGTWIFRWVDDPELFLAVFEKILGEKPIEYHTFAGMGREKSQTVFKIWQKARPLTLPERIIAARCSQYQYLETKEQWYAFATLCSENASSGKWLNLFKNMWRSKAVGSTTKERLQSMEQVLVTHQECIQKVSEHYYGKIDKDTWLSVLQGSPTWDGPFEIVFGSETVSASLNLAISLWFDTYTTPSSEKLEQLWETYPQLYEMLYKKDK